MPIEFDPLLHPLEHDGWKSDHILSDHSAKEFRELYRTVSASLGRLDSEIARIQAALDKLLHDRAIYVSRMDKINSAVAIHKKIPPEILSQIFHYTVHHTIRIDLNRNAFKTRNFPISSQICSRWRQITLATQNFWNSIEMKCVIGDWEYSDEIIGVAHTIVSRGSGFVKLCLTDIRDEVLAHHASIQGFIGIISRAKHISLSTVSFQRLLHDVLEISPPFFPVLESVELSSSGPERPAIDIKKCCIFSNAPRLVTVRFSEMKGHILISLPSFELPWSQLQKIVICNPISLPAAHSILSQCSRLMYCRFQIGGDSGQTTVLPPFICGSIYLSCLINLSVMFSSESREVPKIEAVLEPLVLPSLTTLAIYPLAADRWYTSIMHLIDRSRCSLKTFYLSTRMSEVPDDALALFRELSPTLVLFYMDHTTISIEMLEQIARGVLFPRLENLRCKVDKSPACLGGLMDLIQHRCLSVTTAGASRILSVDVRCSNRDGEVSGWVDTLNRFDVVAKEVAKIGCTAVLKNY